MGFGFFRAAKFGALPEGARLERILRSPNYRDGGFQNQLATPMMTSDEGPLKGMAHFAFNRSKRLKPEGRIPSERVDLHALPKSENYVLWLGHSSVLLQIDGKTILLDPVLSGRASPVSFTTKAFDGTDPYTVADLPRIDYLFISHDHWDHLDYETVMALRPKVGKVVCPLGVGAHLERWGYSSQQLIEGDWHEEYAMGDGFSVHFLPARHFSGRLFKRNQSLWSSFAVVAPSGFKLFMSGDSGHGPHFAEIGRKFGGFDLALMENGQYDRAWRHVHMLPDETLKAAAEVGARRVLPIHNSKFCICNHDWDAPLKTLTALDGSARVDLITPKIGRPVSLAEESKGDPGWWLTVS